MSDITIQKPVEPQAGQAISGKPTRLSNPGSFGKMLTDSIDQVNRLQVAADSSINDLAMGKQTDIHRTMVAMEKAEWGKRGKHTNRMPTALAITRSKRGKSEKSNAFFNASIRIVPSAGRP